MYNRITNKFHKEAGFTLTELMVALVINLLVFSSLVGMFVANINHYTTALNTNRLNQQLQAAMQLMVSDIRRAGYWANAATLISTDTNTNPFMSVASGTDVTIGGAGNSCILFTYDHGSTGVLPAVNSAADDDRYGYRLNGGALQTRTWGAPFSCAAAASTWENITDSTVTITALTFTLGSETVATGLGTSGLLMRNVTITLTGELTNETAITKTLTMHVRIRNDYFET